MANVKWIATLDDGTTAVENTGEWTLRPGERRPWVQFTEYLGREQLYLTSLRLNIDGRTVHMPRASFDRFDLNDVSRAPLSYSLCYHLEGEIDVEIGELVQTNFIELSAHYADFVVSYIQDTTDGDNSWIVVTDDRRVMAETPRRNH